MINKLYRKLYIYAIIILTASITFTITITNLFFMLNEDKMRDRHFYTEATFIRSYLQLIAQDYPQKFPEKIRYINESLKMSIAYYNKHNLIFAAGEIPEIHNDKLESFLKEKKTKLLHGPRIPPTIMIFLEENKPEKGYLIMKFPPPPHHRCISPLFITGILILLFLK